MVDRAYGDIEALTAELKELMAQEGLDFTIGKSSIGEEALRLKEAQESLAETTRMMQTLAEIAPDSAAMRSETLNAMVSEEIFIALLEFKKARKETDPASRLQLMNKLSLGTGRISATDVRQRRLRHEVEQRAKLAAAAVAKIAKTGGLGAEQVRQIRAQILGIGQPAAAPTATV